MNAKVYLLVVSSLLVMGQARANYAVADLGGLGGDYTRAHGINSSGRVTGRTSSGTGSGAFITALNGADMRKITVPSSYSYGVGVNTSGQVVGQYLDGANRQHTFITGPDGYGFTELPLYAAAAINDAGQVAGSDAAGRGYLFVPGGSLKPIDPLMAGGWTEIHGVNASGQIAGSSAITTSCCDNHAFITGSDGVGTKDIGVLGGGRSSVATAINVSGQTTGFSGTGKYVPGLKYPEDLEAVNHAFITNANGEGMRDLGVLGGDFSYGYAINASGQVVGASTTAISDWPVPSPFVRETHAFVTGANGAGMIDLNAFVVLAGGHVLYEAVAINDAGQIVVNATNFHAYLLTPMPVPEPESLVLLVVSLPAVYFASRRHLSRKARS